MHRRSFFWTLAHMWLSLLFGLLLSVMLGRVLAPVEVPSSLGVALTVLCLLLGNPFFTLIRYKNGIAICFFTLLAIWDVVIAGQALVFFLVLVCARRKLHELELRKKDLQVATKKPPRLRDAHTKKKPLRASSKVHGYAESSTCPVKPSHPHGNAMVDLLPPALTSIATSEWGGHMDPGWNAFNFATVWPLVNNHHDWDTSSTSMFDFETDVIGINPANGLPMATHTMDVMGNPFGCSSSSLSSFGGSDFLSKV